MTQKHGQPCLFTSAILDFGLQVHLGKRHPTDDSKDVPSKTEAMYFPTKKNRKIGGNEANNLCSVDQYLSMTSFDIEGTDNFVSFSPVFKYLGSNITMEHCDTFDINQRISSATKSFGSLRKVLCDRNIDKKIRAQIYLAIPISILLWSCEAWAIGQGHIKSLATFHHKCAKQMCGINQYHHRTYHITNTSILKNRLGIQRMDQILTKRQLCFLRRVSRMPEEQLTRQVLSSWATKNQAQGLATATATPPGDLSKMP